MSENSFKLSLSPLQGYTDFAFRNAMNEIIGGVDTYYAPYLRFQKDGSIKTSQRKEILAEHNQCLRLVPQIMASNAADFLLLAQQVEQQGFTELNWNLGCPYPMVTRLGLGSGLLKEPQKIEEILNTVLPQLSMKLSIKTRLGCDDPVELASLVPIFNQFPLQELIIHPRIGKQLYKGTVDLEYFERYASQFHHPVAYNGDIRSLADFKKLQDQFSHCKHFMIGRGLLYNPFLAQEIKQGAPLDSEVKRALFINFHARLYNHYCETLFGPAHLMNKMHALWEYLAELFINPRKTYKLIRKAGSPKAFERLLPTLLEQEAFQEQ